MTRKHFEALAAALKDSKPDPPDPLGVMGDDFTGYREALAQWRIDMLSIAAVCSAFNPRFDDGRFYAACGYKLHTAWGS